MRNSYNRISSSSSSDNESSRRHNMPSSRSIARVSLALLGLVSAGRLVNGTLDSINDQHNGDNSFKETVVDFAQRDYNKWSVTKDLYAGNEDDGFGINQVLNIGALVCAITIPSALKNRGPIKKYKNVKF